MKPDLCPRVTGHLRWSSARRDKVTPLPAPVTFVEDWGGGCRRALAGACHSAGADDILSGPCFQDRPTSLDNRPAMYHPRVDAVPRIPCDSYPPWPKMSARE